MSEYHFRMKRLFLYFFLAVSLVFSSESRAVDQKDLDFLITRAAREGQRQESYAGIYKTLKHSQSFGADSGYQANYFSVVGGEDNAGNFHTGRIELVSEYWKLDPDGNWNIDQWLYKLSIDGRPMWVAHYRMIQTPQGLVLLHQGVTSTPAEEALVLEKLLNFWIHLIR